MLVSICLNAGVVASRASVLAFWALTQSNGLAPVTSSSQA